MVSREASAASSALPDKDCRRKLSADERQARARKQGRGTRFNTCFRPLAALTLFAKSLFTPPSLAVVQVLASEVWVPLCHFKLSVQAPAFPHPLFEPLLLLWCRCLHQGCGSRSVNLSSWFKPCLP